MSHASGLLKEAIDPRYLIRRGVAITYMPSSTTRGPIVTEVAWRRLPSLASSRERARSAFSAAALYLSTLVGIAAADSCVTLSGGSRHHGGHDLAVHLH